MLRTYLNYSSSEYVTIGKWYVVSPKACVEQQENK